MAAAAGTDPALRTAPTLGAVRTRRLIVLAAMVAAICASTPGVARAAGAASAAPPDAAVAAVGVGRATVVGYRDFVGRAQSHFIRTAVVDTANDWVVGANSAGEVFAARIPRPTTGSGDLAARLRGDGVRLVSPGVSIDIVPLLVFFFGPLLLIVGFGMWVRRRRGPVRLGRVGIGPGHGRIRPSARVEAPPVRFADVAGCDEAVLELQEVVAFLRDPERVTRLGGRMPRGVILHGPPGTGKTLLARATSGEAGVPFFSVSGAEFVDTYVGVGASRVRDLFAKARAEGGVIFIDEIDAAGRVRGAGPSSGASDEREATLNQILVEMDGITSNANVLVIAATNRLDLLDRALLRPGRFDRHVRIGLPGREGRLAILRLHARGKPLADAADLERLAASTGGAAGADLANILNEAALMAARAGRDAIVAADLEEGQLRHWAGPQRTERLLSDTQRMWVAVHEAGHCLAAELCPGHAKAETVTILARGEALGLAFYGDGDHHLDTPEDLRERMIVAMAGRAAEQLCFGRIGAGAANDLEKANVMARQAVETLGFSARVGQIVTHAAGQAIPLAEGTRLLVDEEVARLVDEAYREAVALLRRHRQELDALVEALMDEEQIDRRRIEQVLGGHPPRAIGA
jgi:cell division protease FtsH